MKIYKVIFRTHKDVDEFISIISQFDYPIDIGDGDVTTYKNAKDFNNIDAYTLNRVLYLRVLSNDKEIKTAIADYLA